MIVRIYVANVNETNSIVALHQQINTHIINKTLATYMLITEGCVGQKENAKKHRYTLYTVSLITTNQCIVQEHSSLSFSLSLSLSLQANTGMV